jgi:hypothetical protein
MEVGAPFPELGPDAEPVLRCVAVGGSKVANVRQDAGVAVVLNAGRIDCLG